MINVNFFFQTLNDKFHISKKWKKSFNNKKYQHSYREPELQIIQTTDTQILKHYLPI